MQKLILIIFLIFLYSNGLAIPDSALQSFPVQGMKGLGRTKEETQRAIDEFNRAMEQTHWARSVTQDVVYKGGAIGNLVPEGYGGSKYDKELDLTDLLSGEKTLDQLRAERKAEDIEEYLKYFLYVGCVIIVLIAVAQSKERID